MQEEEMSWAKCTCLGLCGTTPQADEPSLVGALVARWRSSTEGERVGQFGQVWRGSGQCSSH